MPKTVTLRLEDRADEESREAADAEMADILANEKLVARLREGSAQARARQGQFVE